MSLFDATYLSERKGAENCFLCVIVFACVCGGCVCACMCL